MSGEYNDRLDHLSGDELTTQLVHKMDRATAMLKQHRSPSKAGLIGPGFDPTTGYQSTHGEWITARPS